MGGDKCYRLSNNFAVTLIGDVTYRRHGLKIEHGN